MRSYKSLLVWQKAFDLTNQIYKLTKAFPQHELYGLTSQVQRAAVAVVANIAEGYGRRSNKEFGQFLRIAYASAAELETELMVAEKQDYGDSKQYRLLYELLNEVMRMLYALDYKVISKTIC